MSLELLTYVAIRALVCILIATTWILLPPDVRIMTLAAAVFGIYHHRAYHVPFAQEHRPLLQVPIAGE